MFQPTALTEPAADPISLSGQLDTLPLAALEASLARLIRDYLAVPSRRLAGRVVRYCEAICAHPELRDYHTLCGYRKLARHWRWLAQA